MTLRTHIDMAGKYPVIQAPCPDFASELVDLTLPPAAVLHTTEGGWSGSMDVFKTHFAPHFILGLNGQGKPEIAQLVPIGTIGAACVAHNNKARVQIEMIGYAKEELWLPDDATLDVLASLMVVCRDEWGIPLSRPWATGDYGRAGNNPHRSSGKFGTVAGWFDHADMPQPDSHWDVGNLNWDAVFSRAEIIAGEPTTSAPQSTVTAPVGPTLSTRTLQHALNLVGLQPPLIEDGQIGPKTAAAIVRYQSAHKLFASGAFDEATIAALRVDTGGSAKA